MKMFGNSWIAGGLLLWVAAGSVPALADVRSGVEAWSRGDYAAAVAEWEGPAAAGDADAMFNLAQAFRLGRGVALDETRAEQLYYRAAQSGHVQAADTYGLMLFQAGRREEALPYVEDAARRGDARSQYLLGIAHFNGDLVERDWVRAYALLTLANSAGLPQAAPAIGQMDEFITLADRQQAAGLAETMRSEAASIRTADFAAADLAATGDATRPVAVAEPQRRVPQPIATVAVSPSVVAARSAIDEASRATGTADPAGAGADYAAPRPAAPVVAAAPAPVAARASTAGPWRVQLGAFSVRSNADRLWTSLASRSEIAGRERLLVQSGRVVKLQAGGFASRAEAQSACSSLQRSGQDCLVTRD